MGRIKLEQKRLRNHCLSTQIQRSRVVRSPGAPICISRFLTQAPLCSRSLGKRFKDRSAISSITRLSYHEHFFSYVNIFGATTQQHDPPPRNPSAERPQNDRRMTAAERLQNVNLSTPLCERQQNRLVILLTAKHLHDLDQTGNYMVVVTRVAKTLMRTSTMIEHH